MTDIDKSENSKAGGAKPKFEIKDNETGKVYYSRGLDSTYDIIRKINPNVSKYRVRMALSRGDPVDGGRFEIHRLDGKTSLSKVAAQPIPGKRLRNLKFKRKKKSSKGDQSSSIAAPAGSAMTEGVNVELAPGLAPAKVVVVPSDKDEAVTAPGIARGAASSAGATASESAVPSSVPPAPTTRTHPVPHSVPAAPPASATPSTTPAASVPAPPPRPPPTAMPGVKDTFRDPRREVHTGRPEYSPGKMRAASAQTRKDNRETGIKGRRTARELDVDDIGRSTPAEPVQPVWTSAEWPLGVPTTVPPRYGPRGTVDKEAKEELRRTGTKEHIQTGPGVRFAKKTREGKQARFEEIDNRRTAKAIGVDDDEAVPPATTAGDVPAPPATAAAEESLPAQQPVGGEAAGAADIDQKVRETIEILRRLHEFGYDNDRMGMVGNASVRGPISPDEAQAVNDFDSLARDYNALIDKLSLDDIKEGSPLAAPLRGVIEARQAMRAMVGRGSGNVMPTSVNLEEAVMAEQLGSLASRAKELALDPGVKATQGARMAELLEAVESKNVQRAKELMNTIEEHSSDYNLRNAEKDAQAQAQLEASTPVAADMQTVSSDDIAAAAAANTASQQAPADMEGSGPVEDAIERRNDLAAMKLRDVTDAIKQKETRMGYVLDDPSHLTDATVEGNGLAEMQGSGLLDSAYRTYPENTPYVTSSQDLDEERMALSFSRKRHLRHGFKESKGRKARRANYENFRRPEPTSEPNRLHDNSRPVIPYGHPGTVLSRNRPGEPMVQRPYYRTDLVAEAPKNSQYQQRIDDLALSGSIPFEHVMGRANLQPGQIGSGNSGMPYGGFGFNPERSDRRFYGDMVDDAEALQGRGFRRSAARAASKARDGARPRYNGNIPGSSRSSYSPGQKFGQYIGMQAADVAGMLNREGWGIRLEYPGKQYTSSYIANRLRIKVNDYGEVEGVVQG